MTRIPKVLADAIRHAERRDPPVCRHGWPMPTHVASRRFVTAEGEVRWGQTTRVTEDAGCPDQPRRHA